MHSKNLWLNQIEFVENSMSMLPKIPLLSELTFNKLKNYLELSRFDSKIRITFVGQEIYFKQSALTNRYSDVETNFIDYKFGSDPATAIRSIDHFDPHIVIVFRPEVNQNLEVALKNRFCIGYFTEPIFVPGTKVSPDLKRRFEIFINSRIYESKTYHLFLGYNSDFSKTLESYLPIWKYLPLPIADEIFEINTRSNVDFSRSQGIFIGRVTDHRNVYLEKLKHFHEWTVIDSTTNLDIRHFDVALNLHNDGYLNFENRIILHMAMNQLVLTQAFSPNYDFTNGFTHLEFTTPEGLLNQVDFVMNNSEIANQIKSGGNLVAGRYKSSRIWSELLTDLSLLAGMS